MAMFQMKWLRAFVRRNTRQIPHTTAQQWKQRLSFGYALLAWNAFGFVLYAVFTGRGDWALATGLKSKEEASLPPAVAFAKQFKMEKAKVVRIQGLSTYTYEIDNSIEEEGVASETEAVASETEAVASEK